MRTERTGRGVLEWAPGVAAAAIVLGMLWLTRRGLEILDESYLLRLIDAPQATRAAGDVYLFGFVLHPVWRWVGEDVADLRAVGILTLAAAAGWLAVEGAALLRDLGTAVPRRRVIVSSLVSAASSTVVLSFNVMVPAYRSVALLGIIIVAAGAARSLRRRPRAAGVLIGVGGWTCFVGKPTSAAALGLMVAAFVVATKGLSLRLVGASVVGLTVAAGATLAVARMTPADVVAYLQGGAHQVDVIGDHPNLRVVLGLNDVNLQGLLVFGPMLLVPALLATALRVRWPARGGLVDALGVVGIVAGAIAAATIASSLTSQHRTGWQVLSVGWLVPGAAIAMLGRQRRTERPPSRALQAWVLLLVAVPYAGAVGSNLPFGTVVPMMAVPWVVALSVLLLRRDADRSAPPAFAVVMTFVVGLLAVMGWVVHTNSPTGGDLADDLRWAPVRGGQLQLAPMDAAAARALQLVAQRDGITPSTPVADLTGVGAGYAFMTGGRPLGRAHMYAYLPDSVAAAAYGIGKESCSVRASAWLLVFDGGTAPLSAAMFVDGLDASDYDVRLRFDASRDDRPLHFELLRPRPEVATQLGC